MSRVDCISNRNIKIIAAYVDYKLGHHDFLFDGIPYPAGRYNRPEDFFLHEDERTTLQNFQDIFRNAKEMVGERYFYFNCGASSAHLRSWGHLDYFTKIFSSACDGFNRLPFFNQNLNDTKEIEILDSKYANMIPQWKSGGILINRQVGVADSGEIKAMDLKQSLYVYKDGIFKELEEYPFNVFPLGAYGGYWIAWE